MANDKSTDTVTTSLGGDTALSQTKESAAKIDNSSETAKENGGNLSVEDKIKAVSQQFGVDKAEVTSVPKAHGEIGGSEVLVTYDKKKLQNSKNFCVDSISTNILLFRSYLLQR